MLTYVLVLVVVVVVLYGSFRALGGGRPVPAEDYRTVLVRLGEFTAARAHELDDALDGAPADLVPRASGSEPRPQDDPLVVAASAARKRLGGYHQQLARLEYDATPDERERLETARTLLNAAVEDLAWACRLVESGTYRDNPGIQGAVVGLRRHGADCMTAAAAMVEPDRSAPAVAAEDAEA